MYRKTIKFKDFDGNDREGTFYFNLTEAEIIQWEGMLSGTLTEKMDIIRKSNNIDQTIRVFSEIIDKAYGEKSLDGMYFRKSPDILANFKATQAYSNLYMELSSNDEAGAAFINGIFPPELIERIEKAKAEQKENGGQLQVLEGGTKKE